MNLFWKKALFFLSAALLLAACGPAPRQRTVAVMDDVETYINERPDSALAVLTAVDTTSLTTRALRARYSLLRVMALDKCYEDITAPGLLDPAVAWKMKTLYYQGRIAQDKKDQKSAAVFYARAEDYAEAARDMHAVGLLYGAIASVYDAVYNIDKEQEYVEKSLAVYKNAQDPIYGSALGDLAIVYQTRQDWSKADSLYQEAIAQSDAYPHAKAIYLSNYARMKVLQPEKDPAGAISFLTHKQQLSGSLTLQEAGAYAYALILSGKYKDAETVLGQLQHKAGPVSPAVEAWLCRCALATGDYKQAFESLSRARTKEDAEIRNVLSNSVTEAVFGYREMAAKQKQLQYRINISVLAIILLLLALALALAMLRKNKLETEKSRILELYSNLEKEAATQEIHTAHLQNQLNRFRETARQERLLRFRQAGKLQSSIWRLDHLGLPAWFKENQDMEAIKEELSYVYDIDDSGEKLVRRLDRELDGAITSLAEKLNLQDKPKEQFFLCCCLLDLPSDVVAAKFELSAVNVRVKKHRLREQIAKLNDADYDALFDIRR